MTGYKGDRTNRQRARQEENQEQSETGKQWNGTSIEQQETAPKTMKVIKYEKHRTRRHKT